MIWTIPIFGIDLFGVEADASGLSSGNKANFSPLPGTDRFDNELLLKFKKMKVQRGEKYHPRTKHLFSDGFAKYTNRLFLESSPYLLQHAHNPVNWYPWGPEAFSKAKDLNRPVLLSIGYSTCHWCHVMEEESFEDEEIAQYLNENYIAIKVDREERPDIDSIYMKAVQALTGSGGWPMTVWLAPDKKPFYGGTYFPARDGDRGVPAGFLTYLKNIKKAYHSKNTLVNETSGQLTSAIKRMLIPEPGNQLPDSNVLAQAYAYFQKYYDPLNGGVQGAPKFPSSLPIRLLLRHHKITGDENALEMATLTLEKMSLGGIYDHIGGGFHRYATDEKWLIPHFEKMLYDNALLAMGFMEAFQVTGKEHYKNIVNETLNYIQKEMTSPEGGFYSATDADSMTPGGKREEGWFFTWAPEELDEILGVNISGKVKAYYTVGETPNFEGRHILHVTKSTKEVSEFLGIKAAELSRTLEESRNKLLAARRKRPSPIRDEKILTSWNGLMISAFARAGFILNHPDFIDTAEKSAHFILNHLTTEHDLFHSFKDGRKGHKAYLDDYAFLISALIDLYEVKNDPFWLEKALRMNGVLEKYFEDKKNGGFYMTHQDQEDLIAREKPGHDNAVPSGNSYQVLNLLRLYALTADDKYLKSAEKTLIFFSKNLKINPGAFSDMLLSIDTLIDQRKEIIIVTPEEDKKSAEPFLKVLKNTFIPNKVLIVTAEGKEIQSHLKVTPLVKDKYAIDGYTTVYVCENGVCKLPVSDPLKFEKLLKTTKRL